VAAVAASAKLASQDPAGEKPSDAQTRGVVLATAAAGAVAVLAAAPKTARASIAEPVQPAVASGIPNKLARQLLQIERLNVDSNGSGDRRTHKPRLDISGNSAKVCIDGYEPEGSDRVQFIWLKNEEADAIVAACVEIKILRRVHAIDAAPARRRGGVDSSPLDGASTAALDALVDFHTGRRERVSRELQGHAHAVLQRDSR